MAEIIKFVQIFVNSLEVSSEYFRHELQEEFQGMIICMGLGSLERIPRGGELSQDMREEVK